MKTSYQQETELFSIVHIPRNWAVDPFAAGANAYAMFNVTTASSLSDTLTTFLHR